MPSSPILSICVTPARPLALVSHASPPSPPAPPQAAPISQSRLYSALASSLPPYLCPLLSSSKPTTPGRPLSRSRLSRLPQTNEWPTSRWRAWCCCRWRDASSWWRMTRPMAAYRPASAYSELSLPDSSVLFFIHPHQMLYFLFNSRLKLEWFCMIQ